MNINNISVKALLSGEISSEYDDKIFWYASEVVINKNQIDIYVEDNNLFTFDNIDLNIKKISTLMSQKQSSNSRLKDVLVSSGSFLFINDKLAVTQRSFTTTYDPGFWTTPAGRCDRTIFETGIKETIEEIQIKQENKILYPDIARKYIPSKENIVFYNTSFVNDRIPIKRFDVKLFLDNTFIEASCLWMHYSQKVNTLEFRIPLFAKLNEEKLVLTNPEYGNATDLKTIKELQNLKTVPALKKLIEEVTNGK